MVRGLRNKTLSEGFVMKSVKKHYSLMIFVILSVLTSAQVAAAQGALSPQDQKARLDFEKQAKDYSALRERIEGEMPKLPKDATADQIEAHKATFQKAVLAARVNAKQGDLFT